MLETKELCKQYKPKKGVPVQAVDHVSLRFPETGMVFLLGKSGSGKSTMLNLLGGLDRYDSGEIIIKGVSSKDFSPQHFDSYRNTYVGFIFQEYNVLEEFTVGANIALALELQGRTASDAELNAILQTVDLAGFGDRKPNELSGGQKQRVAIARALVKNPQIIMADEPTGALDSNTGRQVLDTLKKLSAEKLVIVVSHDREYAEQYADRIIELADGKVIRDVEAQHHDADDQEKQLVFRAATVEIPPDYHLTEDDRIRINEYLDQLRSGASLTLPGRSQRFADTDESRIPKQDGSGFSLIKSRLPMKSAFKIGCSSLKHKRFRLVMTILLSVAAFTMFSLVDTFSSYNHIRACTDSLLDSGVGFFSVNKSVKLSSGDDTWWSANGQRISEAELAQFSADTGLSATGLYVPRNGSLRFDSQYDVGALNSENSGGKATLLQHFCGFAELTEQSAKDMRFRLTAGTYPDGSKNEIAVSTVLANTFMTCGYLAPPDEDAAPVSVNYEKITSPAGLVGKTIRLMGTDYTVSGIVDTGLDMSRYEKIETDTERLSNSERVLNFMLREEFMIAANYSLTGCAMVGPGKLQELTAAEPKIFPVPENGHVSLDYSNEDIWGGCWVEYVTTLDRVPDSEIIWLDGKKDHLADNEVVISLSGLDMGNSEAAAADEKRLRMLEDMKRGAEPCTQENLCFVLEGRSDLWTLNVGEYTKEYRYRFDNYPDMRIVGVVKPGSSYDATGILPENYIERFIIDEDCIYDSAVGAMPQDYGSAERLVAHCYRTGDDVTMRYELNDPAVFELDTFHDALKLLAKVFLYVGIGFAVFALLLMANFISTSIHYKRQEIGILRAIGSRSNDVFRIFFSESFVIAMIYFTLSAVLGFAAVTVINRVLRTEAGILVTVLHFGFRQILLLFAICLAGAALASFFPVRRIAAKKPIDAIRDK
ncbi:MAG: ABC transporter ATP-binding protein/permease [Oscillospiraceae bacterium]|nr:ABC transporter ATP-binding protein/permease [Oscillospiraceae bacterium]